MDINKTLFGSVVQPDIIQVHGVSIGIDSIISTAFRTSGLSVKDWNLLDEEFREKRIQRVIDSLERKV